jgi:SAM-dependent methyltransferase
MTSPAPGAPQIFDTALLRRRLARAIAAGPADFLLQRVVEDMVERLSLVKRDFARVLDLGTPGRHLTRALRALYPAARVTHLAPIESARAEAPSHVGDVETARFEDGCDLIVSALAFQHVDDLPGVLAKARRALAPDGLMLVALVGGRSLTELRAALTQAEDEARGGASPRVAPFVDLRDLGALAQRAGLALPVTDVETLTVRYGDALALMRDLRAMGATSALRLRGKPLTREILARAAAIYAENFSDADGRVRATFEIVWLSGWAPHESQQKPLRPGEGRARLADALVEARRAAEATRESETQENEK